MPLAGTVVTKARLTIGVLMNADNAAVDHSHGCIMSCDGNCGHDLAPRARNGRSIVRHAALSREEAGKESRNTLLSQLLFPVTRQKSPVP